MARTTRTDLGRRGKRAKERRDDCAEHRDVPAADGDDMAQARCPEVVAHLARNNVAQADGHRCRKARLWFGQDAVDQVVSPAADAFECRQRRAVVAESLERTRLVRVVDAAARQVVGEISVSRRLLEPAVEGDHVLRHDLRVARQPDVDRCGGLWRPQIDHCPLQPAVRRPHGKHQTRVLVAEARVVRQRLCRRREQAAGRRTHEYHERAGSDCCERDSMPFWQPTRQEQARCARHRADHIQPYVTGARGNERPDDRADRGPAAAWHGRQGVTVTRSRSFSNVDDPTTPRD